MLLFNQVLSLFSCLYLAPVDYVHTMRRDSVSFGSMIFLYSFGFYWSVSVPLLGDCRLGLV